MLFLKFVNKYFRKNFFDNFEEFRYPNMSYAFNSFGREKYIDQNSIGFSNRSILINDEIQRSMNWGIQTSSSIFSRKHQNWIERKISNSKYGQIVTLKNFKDER